MDEKVTNPDDVILKKKYYQDKPDFLKGDPDKIFVKEKDPVTGLFDWWNNLPVRPFVSVDRGPKTPGGKSITIGIRGTF